VIRLGWFSFSESIHCQVCSDVVRIFYCKSRLSLVLAQHKSIHIENQGAARSSYVEEVSLDTCNIVIFGETGAGKSSLVNLIVGPETAPASCDAEGCTIETREYSYDLAIHNMTLRVNIFDTAGQCRAPLFLRVTELDCRPW
jgi:tRNA U34 5-carboxymethylaminomethyl modifying GTPase MnmE/TrmE